MIAATQYPRITLASCPIVPVPTPKNSSNRDIEQKFVARVVFHTGLIGDAGRLGRVFFGTGGFLLVVFLPDPLDRGDGEESTVLTKRTSISSRIIGISTVCLIGAAEGSR